MNYCNVCDNHSLKVLLFLPSLPLTGIYVHQADAIPGPLYDQQLLFCDECGHAQLGTVLPPETLYNQTYTHRSSVSEISRSGNKELVSFIRTVSGGKQYASAFDIGCNDGHLLSLLKGIAEKRSGIDPIANDQVRYYDGAKLYRHFINSAPNDIVGGHDLVVSSHTFEHIERPKDHLSRVVKNSNMDAVFVIEVPCLDTMTVTHRWDQVFHQHVNYFSVASMNKMIEDLGCKAIGWRFNYNYWGGTMMVAFTRGRSEWQKPTKLAISSIQDSTLLFDRQVNTLRMTVQRVAEAGENVCGFGAAQMFPILNYHTDVAGYMSWVFDDNESRHGLIWPDLPPAITKPPRSLENYSVVVTALDSSRAIIRRCTELNAKRIIVPMQVI